MGVLAATVQAEDFTKEKIQLGKKKCLCDFSLDVAEKCKGTAKCDKKCSGSGEVEIGGCSFTLVVKKGKGKISKCSCKTATTAAPTTGETPVPITGSGSEEPPMPITGSGSGPVPITGSGSGAPPAGGEGMQCSCKCDCPDRSGECDCDCNCPMTSKAVNCAPGFCKVCPMVGDACPQDMEPICPNNAMSRMAGGAGDGHMADKGCQCVPDFLMDMVMIKPLAPAGRMTAVDRAMTKATIQVGKKKCKCSYEMNAENCKKSKITCDKKCSGKASGVELEDGMYMLDIAVKKGKVTIAKCDVQAAPAPTGTGGGSGGMGSGSASGNGGGGTGGIGSRCACVSMGMGGTGPVNPPGSGSGTVPTGSGSGPVPTGSGSGPATLLPPTGSGSGSGIASAPTLCDSAGCSVQTYYGTPDTLSLFTKNIFAIWWDPAHDHSGDAEPLADILIRIRDDCLLNLGMMDPPNPKKGFYYNVYIHHGEDDLFPSGWVMGQGTDPFGLPFLTLHFGGMGLATGGSQTVYHEGFHIFQYDQNSPGFAYSGDSMWYTESSAQWYTVSRFREDRGLCVQVGAIVANPQLALWHSFHNHGPNDPASNEGRPGWMYGVRQYGMHTYLMFLTEVAGVERNILTDGFYAQTDLSPQEYFYAKVGAQKMRGIFADWAAHNTGGLDYLTKEQVERGYLEITLAGDWDYYRPYVWSSVDEGTGSDWFTPTADLSPRGWAYNVININNTQTTTYTFDLEGDATGSQGAPSFFVGRVVLMSKDGPVYSEMTMTSAVSGQATIAVTSEDSALFLIIASVPEFFTSYQHYGYKVKVTK